MLIRKTLANIKTKRLEFKLESALVTKDAAGDCIIEGYANTMTKDRVGDVVMPKAFEKTLETYMKNPVLLANHDWNDPCGVVISAEVTDKGLWIKARISNTRQDIKTLIREGCLRTFSIGYNEVDCDYDEATKTKYIKELELLEISVVTVPANTEATFTEASVKADAEGAEKTDDSAKSAPVARTAKELTDYISLVKSVIERDLDSTETVAVCDYFINEKEDTMTKEQLIAALKGKSAPAASAAAPAPDAKADGEAAPAAAAEQGSDPIKEIMAKLDAIGQAMAQIMEGMKPKAEEPAAEEKPADEGKQGEQPAADEEEEMSDEECAKQLQEIEEQILDLEDSADDVQSSDQE